MTTKDDGGSAFPHYTGNPSHWDNGMTLRDWFAGQALAGLYSGMGRDLRTSPEHLYKDALIVYDVADAMIRARSEA